MAEDRKQAAAPPHPQFPPETSLNFSPSAQTPGEEGTEVSARRRRGGRPLGPDTVCSSLPHHPPSKNVYCPFYNRQMAAQGLLASSPTVTA